MAYYFIISLLCQPNDLIWLRCAKEERLANLSLVRHWEHAVKKYELEEHIITDKANTLDLISKSKGAVNLIVS